MGEIELNVIALNASATAPGNFVMVLQEINGIRRIPIIIGLPEAQSIAVALEQIHPLRPITHDLMLNTIYLLKASLDFIEITGKQNDMYTALIVIKDQQQKVIEVDSRTSDAIALAIRQQCPIRISEALLSEIAVENATSEKVFQLKGGDLAQNTLVELYSMLSNALKLEDYESATIIRNIINKKEKK
ncbi:MAG: bifunctional nuclease family protein [Chitinophagales bacterium]